MIGEQLVMVCCSDLSGHVKGKGFPASDLAARMTGGIGWVPTNAQITAFNSIAETPFGALGDLMLIPDPDAGVKVDFGDGTPMEQWFLGDIREMDGRPWPCCLRSILADALGQLKAEAGLTLKAAFELEFQFLDGLRDPGAGFGLGGFRQKQGFGEVFVAAMRAAGLRPDSFLKEWGPRQYEVTLHPEMGIRAADHAVVMREMARATAARLCEAITFTPILAAGGVGNGLHIHMSLMDDEGRSATWDAEGVGGLSKPARHFVAGILANLPSIIAFLAPSVISYARLVPHRWSAAFTNLGLRDREAAVRICPVQEGDDARIARQFHFEVRACDNAASPHIQLAALVLAGLDGIRRELEPPEPGQEDLSLLDDAALAERGVRRLPGSLADALGALEADPAVRSWFREPFVDIYLKHKRSEIAHLSDLDTDALHAAYAEVY